VTSLPSIGDLLVRVAKAHGDRVAVADAKRSLTFQSLDDRSNRIANWLLSTGIPVQSRVAVLRPNSLGFVEDEFGLLKAGMTEVLLNPRLSAMEQRKIVDDAGVAAILAAPELSQRAAELGHASSVQLVLSDDDEREDHLLSASPVRTHQPSIARGDSLWRLHYTSGTTGDPKAAVLTQSNFVHWIQSLYNTIGSVATSDVLLNAAPMATAGSWMFWGHYLAGARSSFLARFEPGEFIEAAFREKATSTLLVPTMIYDLVDAIGAGGDRPQFQTILYAAASIAPARLALALETLGPVLVQSYSMSETMTSLTVLSKSDHISADPDRLASAGLPMFDVDIRLLDDVGKEVDDGQPGRVVVKTAALMREYWRRPEQTREAIRDGWLYSGDVGRFIDQGYLQIVDRLGDVLVTGGYNVYPREVEDVLMNHTAVLEACVVGVPDSRFGEVVKGVVRLRPGASANEAELIKWCRSLSGFKVPKTIDLVDEPLPRNPAGKVLRRRVRERYTDQPAGTGPNP
jgi:acyl-CoA synthetase (AMP-forming)/AMP-acid ligase II